MQSKKGESIDRITHDLWRQSTAPLSRAQLNATPWPTCRSDGSSGGGVQPLSAAVSMQVGCALLEERQQLQQRQKRQPGSSQAPPAGPTASRGSEASLLPPPSPPLVSDAELVHMISSGDDEVSSACQGEGLHGISRSGFRALPPPPPTPHPTHTLTHPASLPATQHDELEESDSVTALVQGQPAFAFLGACATLRQALQEAAAATAAAAAGRVH